MDKTFHLEIITPQRAFYSGDVEMVAIKTIDGEMGVLKGHIPMVVPIAVGPIKIFESRKRLIAVVSEGFMEINRDKTVILVDTAEWPEEIDISRAEAAKARALERLKHKLGRMEYMCTQAALSRAMARLKVSREFLRK